MFAVIRFEVNAIGEYVEKAFYIHTSDWIEAARSAKYLCMGYRLGSNKDAFIQQINSISHAANAVTNDADLATFSEYIEGKLQRESEKSNA